MNPTSSFSLLIALLGCGNALAQDPVAAGKGSYAASPPPGLVLDPKRGNADLVAEVESRRLFLAHDRGQPIPSNKWYQNLIFQQFGTGLWAMPHKVDATPEGIEVFFPTTFSGDGVRSIAEFPLVITGKDFKPVDSRATSWADWSVSFRSFESASRHIDVTLGEGMPAVWCEFAGVRPIIAFGGHPGKGSRGKNAPSFFDISAAPLTLPQSTDALGVRHEGRSYAVFAPDRTAFSLSDAGVEVAFHGTSSFLVVCPLPADKDIAHFHRHAFSVPRDTRLSWDYDRAAGTITTTWKIVTEPLKPGAAGSVIQGFLPHHWRENTADLELGGPSYTTIRGTMKCGAGDSFTIAYPFHGILPNLPAPSADTFDSGRVRELLAQHYTDPAKKLGSDTYWGGKDLQRYAQAAFIAARSGDPAQDAILAALRGAMEDWFTYTPGEKERFFAYYPRRKGLVGFKPAYGSQHFTDHHFHLGYFVFSAALLGQLDPDFLAAYGDFARLLAKSYANADRGDSRFPFLRTFDIWRGHSFADGNGFPEGNNQESTGEAVNSWAALILLGEALGDAEMTATGVMGYAFESRANLEYWFDPHGDVFPKEYAHEACGMIWCDSIVWGTWFTASPAWIYGIQWIPTAPHAAFYARIPNFVTDTYADVERELAAFEEKEAAEKPDHRKKPVEIKSLGGELASYHLGFLMHADAPRAVAEFDKLWEDPEDKVARDPWMANLYWQAGALTALGRVDWNCHGDSPTSMVYTNGPAKSRTLIAWNPTARPRTVRFFEGAKQFGVLEVQPYSIASAPAPHP